ncbi:hypothetical protein IE81DRAFT_324367 [Ceraceosorus guamensis]|uniref:Uncharacterized protein n=1 Tax=Ceraceosorus guamensis TaxID=1522189 RepID=A0A316VZ03_9BASI|nr:hypothetical protein IE81DRAFT_324367 [Ceraceosorus guamensis]PWN41623.1 hypothetical protein IE81DRAFT_324367 [Ceraceosorus guamensis]
MADSKQQRLAGSELRQAQFSLQHFHWSCLSLQCVLIGTILAQIPTRILVGTFQEHGHLAQAVIKVIEETLAELGLALPRKPNFADLFEMCTWYMKVNTIILKKVNENIRNQASTSAYLIDVKERGSSSETPVTRIVQQQTTNREPQDCGESDSHSSGNTPCSCTKTMNGPGIH